MTRRSGLYLHIRGSGTARRLMFHPRRYLFKRNMRRDAARNEIISARPFDLLRRIIRSLNVTNEPFTSTSLHSPRAASARRVLLRYECVYDWLQGIKWPLLAHVRAFTQSVAETWCERWERFEGEGVVRFGCTPRDIIFKRLRGRKR